MELKLKYKYRLMLDESWSFGIVGKSGRGVTEVFGVPVRRSDHYPKTSLCLLLTFSRLNCAGESN